jgi:amino acid transporter
VFTSRIIPKAGPFLGWMESWTLAFSSVAIIAFEVPWVVRNLQITGRIIGVGTGSDFFSGANSWFTEGDTGLVTGTTGFVAALIVLALVALIVFQPTRRFHRIVTSLAALGLAAGVVMFVLGLFAIDPATFAANLPQYTNGVTVDQLATAATDAGLTTDQGINLDPAVFSFMAGVLLFQYIGFQYSAYISGEVRGNVRRGILIALLGSLAIGVFMNSVYTDWISSRLEINGQVGWGATWWGFITDPQLPMGQPNSMPLMGVVANPGLWPIWAIISLAVTIFPFLLCPVYIIFLSRIQLAWSLDRQVPEWFGQVSERLRAPANAIFTALIAATIFAVFQNFAILKSIGLGWLAPNADPNLDGKLNLVSTAWFGILAGAMSWIMPGFNALLIRFTRRDLAKDAPWSGALPFLGVIWLVFAVVLYWFAGLKPIIDNVTGAEQDALTYLNQTGVSFLIIIIVVGAIVYTIQALRNRAKGIDTSLMYHEIPPD